MRAISSIPFTTNWSSSLLDQFDHDGEKENAKSTHPRGKFVLIKDKKVFLRDSKEKPREERRSPPSTSVRYSTSLGLMHRNGSDNKARVDEASVSLTARPLTDAVASPAMPPLSPAYSQSGQEDGSVMEMLNIIEEEVGMGADGLSSPSMPPLSPDYSIDGQGECLVTLTPRGSPDITLDSGAANIGFYDFLHRSGLAQAPEDVKAYLQTLFQGAEEGSRAKEALESMRQGELEIAAREADENARQIALIVSQSLP